MRNRLITALCFSSLAASLAACGPCKVAALCGTGETTGEAIDEAPATVARYTPNIATLPAANITDATYPTEGVGTFVGDVVADISWTQAFFDRDFLCKAGADNSLLSSDGVRSLSLSDLHKGNPFCPERKKKVAWLIASAGW